MKDNSSLLQIDSVKNDSKFTPYYDSITKRYDEDKM